MKKTIRKDRQVLIKKLYLSGLTAKEISLKFHMATGSVLKCLREMGVVIRPRGGANHTKPYLAGLHERETERVESILSNKDTTLKTKAMLLNVTPATLRTYLRLISKPEPTENPVCEVE